MGIWIKGFAKEVAKLTVVVLVAEVAVDIVKSGSKAIYNMAKKMAASPVATEEVAAVGETPKSKGK